MQRLSCMALSFGYINQKMSIFIIDQNIILHITTLLKITYYAVILMCNILFIYTIYIEVNLWKCFNVIKFSSRWPVYSSTSRCGTIGFSFDFCCININFHAYMLAANNTLVAPKAWSPMEGSSTLIETTIIERKFNAAIIRHYYTPGESIFPCLYTYHRLSHRYY